MRYCALLCAIIMLAVGAQWTCGQIVLTEADLPQVGEVFTDRYLYDVDLNTGPSGENQTWTIPDYGAWTVGTSAVVAPSSTPFFDLFPTATLCFTASSVESYTYVRVAANGVFFLGSAGVSGVDTMLMRYDSEVTQFPLPMSYPISSWTRVARWSQPYGGSDSVVYVDSSLCDVDAWGTLITPFAVMPALRIRMHVYNTYLEPNHPPQVNDHYEYQWLSDHPPTGAFMQSTQQPPEPNFTRGNMRVSVTQGDVAGRPRGPVAEGIAVGQNYPNPFNPTTVLPVELQRAGEVTVSIFNETGRIVSTREYELAAGRHQLPISGRDWSSGTYFTHVSFDNRSQTTKMQLIK